MVFARSKDAKSGWDLDSTRSNNYDPSKVLYSNVSVNSCDNSKHEKIRDLQHLTPDIKHDIRSKTPNLLTIGHSLCSLTDTPAKVYRNLPIAQHFRKAVLLSKNFIQKSNDCESGVDLVHIYNLRIWSRSGLRLQFSVLRLVSRPGPSIIIIIIIKEIYIAPFRHAPKALC